MNQEQIGKFIADCRKEKGLTQMQLAEKLGITNRAISKWENGKSMPDVALLMPLCEILGISVNELLSGQRITMEKYEEIAENNFEKIMKVVDKKLNQNKILKVIIILLAAVIAANLAYSLGEEIGRFAYLLFH